MQLVDAEETAMDRVQRKQLQLFVHFVRVEDERWRHRVEERRVEDLVSHGTKARTKQEMELTVDDAVGKRDVVTCCGKVAVGRKREVERQTKNNSRLYDYNSLNAVVWFLTFTVDINGHET
jgi:hypothetical protein